MQRSAIIERRKRQHHRDDRQVVSGQNVDQDY
jgi:hypothetical protein